MIFAKSGGSFHQYRVMCMGTKLKCAINPLATSQNSSKLSFTVHFVDDYFRTRVVKENCQMERALEKQHMESIRKTMQMHENIFKHQVRELHRLYSVQKMLMDELKRKTSSDVNQQHLRAQTTCVNNSHVQAEPSTRERSGSPGDTMKIVRGFDLERPAGEDISVDASAVVEDQAGPSSLMHSRISHMSIQGSDDSEVELTLSIGGSSSSKRMAENSKPHTQELGSLNSHSIHMGNKELDSSASFKSERGEDCSGPNILMSASSATFDQERKRPHWLFQGLNINRT
ncbi:uncharacterized protein LOC108469109 [Gossypium arboreum]|uniref:uncharacterized protein LOC108469109 n=1 Tax=Gossypium arboreum TaxID=29729 RepID=UPI0022F155C3|nr:uncharacterized protein LOC108469109 [Gossypium arboreum]